MVLLSAQITTGSSAARSYPVSLVMSGLYDTGVGVVWGQDSWGWQQSLSPSTSHDTTIINLSMGASKLAVQSEQPKYAGYSLRLQLHFRA